MKNLFLFCFASFKGKGIAQYSGYPSNADGSSRRIAYDLRKVFAIAIYFAVSIIVSGCRDKEINEEDGNGKGSVKLQIVAGKPVVEYDYTLSGFLNGCTINFNLVVTDAGGQKSITIKEVAKYSAGRSDDKTQTREIPISGPGTYPVRQFIYSGNSSWRIARSGFTYIVSANGETFSTPYQGLYSGPPSTNWNHVFGIH